MAKKGVMLTSVCFLTLFFMCADGNSSLAFSDDEVSYRWIRPIQIPDGDTEELISVSLDSEIYSQAGDSLHDLRIIGSDGSEVPFLIRRQSVTETRKTRKSWAARMSSAVISDDSRLGVIVSLRDEEPSVDALSVKTPLQDFEQRILVYGLADESDSGPGELLADEMIFDYSRHVDIHRNEIRLKENSARTLKIVIDALTSDQESQIVELTRSLNDQQSTAVRERLDVDRRPFRIDQIRLHHDAAQETVTGPRMVEWPVEVVSSEIDTEARQSRITVSTHGEPVSSIRLITDDRNFSRRATVVVPDEEDEERTAASGTVHRFRFKGIEEQKLTLSFSTIRSPQLTVLIDNGDSPPVTIESVEAKGPVDELLFLAQTDQEYSLLYGAADSLKPGYDLAAIRELLKRDVIPVVASLGVSQINSDEQPQTKLSLREIINNKLILGVGVCLLCGLLAWTLYSAGKRVEQDSDVSNEV